jgi:hypothetical protein
LPGVSPALAAENVESVVDSVCRIIDSSALAQHLPVAFLTRLIWRESNFQPDIVSPAGARGIAQFMPGTAAERGLANPDDPEAAIPKAAELLANLKQRFGNLGLAAAAYNAGPTRVANWLAGAGALPPETRDYVMIVTRHPVEDWNGVSAANLTDDAVFPDSSCVQHIALVSRAGPAALAASAWTPWGAQFSIGFSKGAAMWNAYASALNTYLSSLPIQSFYDTYIRSQFRLDVIVCAALFLFLLAYIGRPLKNIRDELRRNKIQLEAIVRSGTTEWTKPIISKPVMAADRGEFLHAEPAERLFESAEPRAWRLARFDPGRQLFRALLPKGVATSQATGPAPAAPAAPEPAALAGDPIAAPDSVAQEKPIAPPPEVILFADAASRRPTLQVKKPKARALKLLSTGGGLAVLAACGAFAIYASPLNSTLGAKSPATAALAAAVDVLKAPLEAITGSKRREEERAEMRDLSAALAQTTVRLDQIEHDYGARLDKLSERIDQDSSTRFADIAARLDKLEQKPAAPAPPVSEFASVMARLDTLEKKAAVAAQPASQFADLASRLDKLEKRAIVPAAPSPEGAESGPRLDKGEKRAAVPAASSAAPLAPPTPKQSALLPRAEPAAANGSAGPDGPRPLLRDYRLEDVRDGVAVVGSRNGWQRVAPGDSIPGAGRVVRIERRGGNWFVVTSLGVIAGGSAPF